MTKFVKILASIALTLSMALCFTSCNLISQVDSQKGDETSSNSESSLIDLEKNEFTFEIDVTNSLDIVPEGVAILDAIRTSVVEVYAVYSNGHGSGSGVVLSISDVDGDGEGDVALIVTCHHVIEGTRDIVVKAIDGKEYFASLVGSDPESDIAVLFIEAEENNKFENLSSATWYDRTSDLKVGTEVYAIGNPLGTLGGTVTSGIISAINRNVNVEGNRMTLIQTDAAINGGNSGGGLFDKNTGALIGIVNAGYASSTAQGLSFAIPGSTAIDVIEQLIGKGYIEGRYDFGVEFSLYSIGGWGYVDYYVGISALEQYGLFKKNGFLVEDVILSVKIGDREEFVLPEINNSNINTIVNELTAYINNSDCEIGDTVTVKYRRFTSGSNYNDYTKTFTVEQYVYGL